jgi:hypothetical protein
VVRTGATLPRDVSNWRQIVGWVVVSISALVACFWAWWGANENFHEGWFLSSVWQNIGLMFVQYLSPMLIVMLVSVVAFRWPRLALLMFGAPALGLAWFLLGRRNAATIVLIIPLLFLTMGVLYHFGRPRPRRWAWGCLIGFPLITALSCGAYPGWLAIHRLDDGNYGLRQIEGNGLTLLWAPEGPGWPSRGVSWPEASRRCAYLSADGRSVTDVPQNLWRLPTVDEAVRSLVFRGRNAGGTWDPVLRRAQYRVTPDKDSPLWKVHSQVIYWWTATEIDQDHAYYITSNGYVLAVPKGIAPGYLAFRCVCERPQ